MSTRYRGRFAPTPSGPLHFGSLVAALGSYLEARCRGGEWWLRIDDLDGPRVQPGATDAILRCLERYGFRWDGPVIYQSQRLQAYHAALHRLLQRGHAYPCACSRSDIARTSTLGMEGPIYAGSCRAGMPAAARARSYRLRCEAAQVELEDAVQGRQHMDIGQRLGDFVLYRFDGVYSFHLASAVDDAAFGMTDIVRGSDLLPSSLRQSHLLALLGAPPPRYTHLPIAVDLLGEKLSKQTHALALDMADPRAMLMQAMAFLGQSPPAAMAQASLDSFWRWAFANWRLEDVPKQLQRGGSSFTHAPRSGGST